MMSLMMHLAHHHRSPVTTINLVGYGIAFMAVAWYNQRKLADAKSKASSDKAQAMIQKLMPPTDEEKA